MRLLNRASQRYLVLRSGRALTDAPGSRVDDADWSLQSHGDGVEIVPSADSARAIVATGERVALESRTVSHGGWQVHRADSGYIRLADRDDPERLLQVDSSGALAIGDDANDRRAMWLVSDDCVADARSVHLRYQVPDGLSLFYNEINVEAAPPGTYFCTSGFGANSRHASPSGYGGVQMLGDGSTNAIFSVWHRMADEVTPVADATATIVGVNPRAASTAFSGEGSGSSIRMPIHWAEGHLEPIRFAVTAERLDDDTAIAAYVAPPGEDWVHLGVIVRARTGGALLSRPYAFAEDFLRNGNRPGVDAQDRSPYLMRSALFSNPWVARKGALEPCRLAEFTVYSPHPLENVAATVVDPPRYGIELRTGGSWAKTRPDIGRRLTDSSASFRLPPDLMGISI